MKASRSVKVIIAHPHRHHVYHLASGLKDSGVSILLVTPLYKTGFARLLAGIPSSIGQKAKGYWCAALDDREVHSPMVWQLLKLLTLIGGASDRSAFTALFDLYVSLRLKRWKPDVVVCMQDYMPRTAEKAKAIGVKLISDQILNQSDAYRQRHCLNMEALNLEVAFPEQFTNQAILGLADAVFTPSVTGAQAVNASAPNARFYLTPYGVSTQFSEDKKSLKPSSVNIQVLARASTVRKGGHLLVPALLKCGRAIVASTNGVPIHVVILGSPDKIVEQLISSSVFADGLSVEWRSVAHLEVVELYRQSSLFIMPSLAESRSLACLEAMMSGLPSVVTPFVDVDEISDGVTGVVVDATIESLAAGIIRAFDSRERWSDWGLNSFRRIRDGDWNRYRMCVKEALIDTLRR